MKVGIMGAGKIAATMAQTINGMRHPEVELYAIASRTLEKARDFAQQHNAAKAFGSYEEMLKDPEVDLIYIATPHSEHYSNIKLCIKYKKAMLVEKAFTANAAQAEEVLELAKANHVFITEAIWTRYMPSRSIIDKLIEIGTIGKVHSIQANLGYHIFQKDRIFKPELAGGALLDIGVYPLNFALMAFGHDVAKIEGSCVKSDTGVDFMDNIAVTFKDGKFASLHATCMGPTDRIGFIYGEKGYIAVTNINNPEKIEVFDTDHKLVRVVPIPQQVTGYEYEVLSCLEALKTGTLECKEMPHQKTIEVLKLTDTLRRLWGIHYPFECLP